MFGSSYAETKRKWDETEVERLQRELKEAEAEIARLRRALGSNHPLGYSSGLLGLF